LHHNLKNNSMQVFKFGGASVSTLERIEKVAHILKQYSGQKILIVVSAIGKTTNALEAVVDSFYKGEKETALQQFESIKQQHLQLAIDLGLEVDSLSDFFTEVEWLLHDKPVRQYDYYYDQVVCVGELLSTSIISQYLNQQQLKNEWVDVRDILRTDNNFRDARINWPITSQKVAQQIEPLFAHCNLILTQGFIGATDENESTTLGREGSDYTAAVFANLLNAESQTIWKDVPGVMNADPKLYESASLITELNYKEVIEMAYYGAQVIHPKTIKPLQNKGIPLLVKSFLQPEAQGTVIHGKAVAKLPPIIVYKQAQALVQLISKDFSFVGEGLTAKVYTAFEQLHFKPNLTQNAAISLQCVVDDVPEKVESFAHALANVFDVQVTKGLTLLTIRHYTEGLLQELCADCLVLLQQKTPETVQVLLRK